MSMFFEESFWRGVLGVFRPQIILLLTQILMPFSIIIILTITVIIYFLAKRFISKKPLNIKNYLIIIIISLLIYYILVGSFMLFIEIGLGRISQNI